MRGGQAFVPKVDRQLKTLAQRCGEKLHLLRLDAFGSAHAEGVPHDNFGNLIVADDPLQLVKVQPLVLAADGREALGGDAERIRNRHPDGLGPDIQAQDSRVTWRFGGIG